MTFRLCVDTTRWWRHLDGFVAAAGDVVPVVKGNGYGFGIPLLAGTCTRLGAPVVAVGTLAEAAQLRQHGPTDLLVLNPLLPGEVTGRTAPLGAPTDSRLIRVAAHRDVLDELQRSGSDQRVVVEMASPLQRFGLPWTRLTDLRSTLLAIHCEGVALHLPPSGNRLGTARAALHRLHDAGIRVPALWVSHLSPEELRTLQAEAGSTRVRLRCGTALWLGDPTAYAVTGQVVDTHAVHRGETVGYRQARAQRSGTIVVVSGGTANGVGLRTASSRRGLRGRAREALAGVLDLAGRAPSPFSHQGHRLPFADVPHMQVSMLLAGRTPPAVGDRLRCAARMTLSSFDEVELVDAEPHAAAEPHSCAA